MISGYKKFRNSIWEKLMKLVNALSEKFSIVEDLIDSEEVELLGDAVKLIRVLSRGSQYLKKRNFRRFIYGLYIDNASVDQLDKLAKYIESKKTSDYLVHYIVELLSSESREACLLEGLYVAELLRKGKEISYEDMCILGFLNEANDFDITNIEYLNEFLKQYKDETFSYDHKIIKFFKGEGVDSFEIESLFELCIRHSLLGRSYSSSDGIEVEGYNPTHPLESRYRVSNPIEFEEVYYTKEPFNKIINMISKCKSLKSGG
ncbi:MAG: hypothetical protein PHV53_10430 [Fermentimonas sp.]|nr:hypothetical protein [Fermentimonas sp.]